MASHLLVQESCVRWGWVGGRHNVRWGGERHNVRWGGGIMSDRPHRQKFVKRLPFVGLSLAPIPLSR